MKTEERDEVIRAKAEILLFRLYRMWRFSFAYATVDDILLAATDEEISYYYYMICVRR